MEIINTLEKFKIPNKTVLTIGNFDGIHLGHQSLIRQTIQTAKKENLSSAVITFKNHPRQVLNPNQKIQILSQLDQKIQLISKLNPDYLIILEFTPELATISAENFVENILIKKCSLNHLIVGEDFALGKNRQGNIVFLENLSKKLKFKLTAIQKVKVKDKTASSNLIRKLLVEQKTQDAEELLGRKLAI